jgi:hypothetical protein
MMMTLTMTTTTAAAGGIVCSVEAGSGNLLDDSDTASGTAGAPPLRRPTAAGQFGRSSPRGGRQYGSPSHGSPPSCRVKGNSSDLGGRMTTTLTMTTTTAPAGDTICSVGAGGGNLHDNSNTALGTSGAPPFCQPINSGRFVRTSPRGSQQYRSPTQGFSPLHGGKNIPLLIVPLTRGG